MSFRPILAGLTMEHPSIRGVVFCDEEGEQVATVITDPDLEEFDLHIAGASYATLVPLMARQGERSRLRVNHGGGGAYGIIWMQMLTPRYYLLLLCHPSATERLLGPHLDTVADAIVMHM